MRSIGGFVDTRLVRRIAWSRKISSIVMYEVKRAFAKKRVLTAVLLILITEIGGALLFRHILYLSRSGALRIIVDPALGWIFLLFFPVFFVISLGILVSAGSLSEEYERGIADILFSKPVTRLELAFGKFIGGLIILAFIVVLVGALSISLAAMVAGPQAELNYALVIMVSSVYANLVFYSMAFMMSETTRNTLISSVVPISLLVILPVVQGILIFVENVSGVSLSLIIRVLPTWAINLPSFLIPREILVRALLASPLTLIFYGSPIIAATSIFGYTTLFIAISLIHLVRSDIKK